jgi:hypothetical protein
LYFKSLFVKLLYLFSYNRLRQVVPEQQPKDSLTARVTNAREQRGNGFSCLRVFFSDKTVEIGKDECYKQVKY